jgi:formylglycine-generating enzyme required for sulfatase activity
MCELRIVYAKISFWRNPSLFTAPRNISFLDSQRELCSFISMSLTFEDTPQGGWSAQTFEIRLRSQSAEEAAQAEAEFTQRIEQQAQSNIGDAFDVLGNVEFAEEAAEEGIIVPEMVFVEGGEFMMGSKRLQDARPIGLVSVGDFEVGKYPVTQEEWESIMGSNPSHFRGERRPVENVSWKDCIEYIEKLNDITGNGFRLLTEAEWEYAAGGGSKDRSRWAGTDEEQDKFDYAWFPKNSDKQTHQVGLKKPNSLGLFDMSGNVWEWCNDWFEKTNKSEQEKSKKREKIVKGGSWVSDKEVSQIYLFSPAFSNLFIGFRLARSV